MFVSNVVNCAIPFDSRYVSGISSVDPLSDSFCETALVPRVAALDATDQFEHILSPTELPSMVAASSNTLLDPTVLVARVAALDTIDSITELPSIIPSSKAFLVFRVSPLSLAPSVAPPSNAL